MGRSRPRAVTVITALVVALAVAGCGSSKSTSSSAGSGNSGVSASSTSATTSSHVGLAKTKFVLHAGLAFGAGRIIAGAARLARPGTLVSRVPGRPVYSRGMPIYEYRCNKGHDFEVRQSFSDDPVTNCEVCGLPVARVFRPIAVHFKGSGFYNTDYGTRKRSRENESHEAAKSESAKAARDSADSGSKAGSDSGGSKSDSGGSKSESGGSKSESSGSKSDSRAKKSESKAPARD